MFLPYQKSVFNWRFDTLYNHVDKAVLISVVPHVKPNKDTKIRKSLQTRQGKAHADRCMNIFPCEWNFKNKTLLDTAFIASPSCKFPAKQGLRACTHEGCRPIPTLRLVYRLHVKTISSHTFWTPLHHCQRPASPSTLFQKRLCSMQLYL